MHVGLVIRLMLLLTYLDILSILFYLSLWGFFIYSFLFGFKKIKNVFITSFFFSFKFHHYHYHFNKCSTTLHTNWHLMKDILVKYNSLILKFKLFISLLNLYTFTLNESKIFWVAIECGWVKIQPPPSWIFCLGYKWGCKLL